MKQKLQRKRRGKAKAVRKKSPSLMYIAHMCVNLLVSETINQFQS